jgi:PAS domain S-box-containing protein
MEMQTRFIPWLVAVSVFVAIFASYVALNLAHSITQARGKAQTLWLACGALGMGVGIWSMHFTGMLAFEMPGMAMSYDIPLMSLSIAVAIGASALALYIISRPTVTGGSLISGGVAMAAAIAGMHYIGMFSMRMAATIQWNVYLVVASIAVALAASFGALLILTRLRDKTERTREMILAATIMGFAIAGMHYTGMLAATFVHREAPAPTDAHLLVTSGLELVVIAAPLALLVLALGTSVAQRVLSARARLSEERFRRLVEAVKDYAIVMLDPSGNIASWNAGAARITGYSDDEIVGRHCSVLMTAADREAGAAAHELAAAREHGHFECEAKRIRKDGSEYWANVVIAPVLDHVGQVTGYSKVIRDITPVKQSERALRRLNEELEERVRARTLALQTRENQLRMITDAVPALIAHCDRDERFLFANDAFCRWFQRSPEATIGHPFRELLGEERYRDNEPYIRRALAGEVTTYERLSHSGSRTANLALTFVPDLDAGGRANGFIILATDITKHREAEAELKTAKAAADQANATKSAFLANMSHEIRTPLGAVLGFAELLYGGELRAPERLECIQALKRNGAILSGVINDILDLSKVEAGKLEIERIEVPFAEVMKDIGTILGYSVAERGLRLEIATEGLTPARITTDPLRLRQILLNIVGNAIKFTRRGSVSIKVKLQPDAQGAMKLAFIVADTGEGIAPEQVQRLFSPFTQADASTTRRFGGTGLGLALSQRLARALGGDVKLLQSTPARGSTFVVTIDPGAAEDQILFQSGQSLPGPEAPRAAHHLRETRIHLADDSPDNQLLVKRILKRAGASVETASNGREAVDLAAKERFDLILMDLQMPEMDGYEATRTLRSQGFARPIVALTAHAMKEERQRVLSSGFDAHLSKPIDHGQLVKTLAGLLDQPGQP